MTIRTFTFVLSTVLLVAQLGACDRNVSVGVPSQAASGGTADDAQTADQTVVATIDDSPILASSDAPNSMTVYKSPNCGCCKDWVTYMQDEGFSATTVDTDDVDAIKAEHGLTNPGLKSCHTALIGGYVIEGHVPASDIRRLLAEQPDVTGLSAPGMPMNSPGMGSRQPKDYDVLAFDEDGSTRVWSSY